MPVRPALVAALTLALSLGGGVFSAASAAPGFAFSERVAGPTRFETAVAASRAAFPQGARTVVLVAADATPDGLTASYAAGVAGAPILYVARTEVPRTTADEIARLGARRVVVVGGESVVGAGVVIALESAGIEVARLAGADRYATAAAVATGAGAAAGSAAAPGSSAVAVGTVLLANGQSPADALAAGPIAYRNHEPILLVRASSVPSATSAALTALAPQQRVLLGGTAVADDAVATAVGATVRLAGADRQGTAVAIAQRAVASEPGFASGSAALVGSSDRSAADALVAAPLAGGAGAPLLFTAGATLGPATSGWLSASAAALTGKGYVLGGTSAVPQTVADTASAAAG